MLERKAPPTFDVLIEIMEMDKLAIHHDVAGVVDRMLRGIPPRPEIRVRNPEGEVEILIGQEPEEAPAAEYEGGNGRAPREMLAPEERPARRPGTTVRIFPYGVSRSRLEKAIRDLESARGDHQGLARGGCAPDAEGALPP